MNHLIDFGVCALVGCTNYKLLHTYFQKILKVHFRCSNLMLHSKSPIIRRKAKRKVQYCKQLNGPRRFEIVLKKLVKVIFSDESTL